MKRVSREAALLVLAALPPLLTAVILFVGGGRFAAFIEEQLIAGTLFTFLALGVGLTLASLPLPTPYAIPQLAVRAPLAAVVLLVPLLWLLERPTLMAALAIAGLMLLNALYRIPGRLFRARAILLGQFLPLGGPVGTWLCYGLFLLALVDLYRLSVFSQRTGAAIRWEQLGGAFALSTTKEFFFRGHYLALAALGLADVSLAQMLRFLDLFSRPTDYLFQRLVDNGLIGGRGGAVLLFMPVVALLSFGIARLPADFRGLPVGVYALIGLASGLVFLVKYLSFEANSRLRFATLSLIYAGSLVAALPTLLLGGTPGFPLIYTVAALALAAITLFVVNRRAV